MSKRTTNAQRAQEQTETLRNKVSPNEKTRVPMSERIGIGISNARVNGHMTYSLSTPELREEGDRLKAELDTATKATPQNDEAIKSAQEALNAHKQHIVRLSNEATIAVAASADFIVRELAVHTFKTCKAEDYKTAQVRLFHTGDMTEMDCYPLIRSLPTIVNYDPEHEDRISKAQADLARARKKAGAEFKDRKAKAIEGGMSPEEAEKLERPKVDAEAFLEESDSSEGPNTSFKKYVGDVVNSIVRDESSEYYGMRLSARWRVVIAQIVAEFVARMSNVARNTVLNLLRVRTLNAQHVSGIIQNIYLYEYGVEHFEDHCNELLLYVSEKVSKYHQVKADQEAHKVAAQLQALTPEERASREVALNEQKKEREAKALERKRNQVQKLQEEIAAKAK
jgi:hypothetical protein